MGQLTHIECSVKRQKWTQVLQALKLTPDQREQLMSNRKEHLNKLRRIFEDRQELNMQVGGRPTLHCVCIERVFVHVSLYTSLASWGGFLKPRSVHEAGDSFPF